MAKFTLELPTELMRSFEYIEKNTEKMLGEMCKAGAEVVKGNAYNNMPQKLKDAISVSDNLVTSRVYKTPSNGAINVQCMITGYFTNEKGKTTPAPLVANMFEYGSTKREYPKQPFFRKAFRKAQIEKAMMAVQQKYIKED